MYNTTSRTQGQAGHGKGPLLGKDDSYKSLWPSFHMNYFSLHTGITDDEGATRGAALFADMAGVRDFEENFEKYGPLMFGLHDGQSEAPKIMAKRVSKLV